MISTMELTSVRTVLKALMVLLAGLLVNFFITLYKRRHSLDGLPKPPFNFLFGHLPVIGKLITSLPEHCHPHMLVHYLRKEYKLPAIFYMDTWPFGYPICAIVDPDVAYQVTVQNSLPKHQAIPDAIWPLVGTENLVSMNGPQHKRWRAIFNPGFSNAHLMTLVDGIVDDSLIFTDILAKHADANDIFSLEEAATKATVDIIGRVVLDTRMHAQTSENDFVSAFRSQLRWLLDTNELNPFVLFNPLRPIVFEYNKRRMDKFIGKVLDERFASRPGAQESMSKKNRPVIDLALDAYLEEENNKSTTIDATFKRSAMDQIKTFMFAGHDTTSSTICYVVHMLSKHPDALQRVRKEYDDVFGTDVEQTARLIKDDPYLLNKLPYSVAIIKEVLRLFPAASSVRMGLPGFFLHHDGKQYPTEGFMVWPVSHALQRAPEFWPEPESFIPERWLVKEGDPLFPVKGAWRPFEFGPRHCIGIELAMIEMKVIMALMLRSFAVKAAYEELDAMKTNIGVNIAPDGERAYQVRIATAKPVDGMPARVARMDNQNGAGAKKPGSKMNTTPEGERAYQVLIATAKPVDGMPARVTRS